MTHGLFVSTKRITDFTHGLLLLITDYLWALHAQQDSLASITCRVHRNHSWVFSYYSQVQKCKIGVTREYFQLVSNRSQAVCFSCYTSPTHELPSEFLETQSVTHVFCKLGCELYRIWCLVTYCDYYEIHYYGAMNVLLRCCTYACIGTLLNKQLK